MGLTTRAYGNIENNVTDISLSRLEQIAETLECDINYILNYHQHKGGYNNNFYNHNGNQGTNIMHQGETDKLQSVYEELIASERKRINILENLLRKNGIEF